MVSHQKTRRGHTPGGRKLKAGSLRGGKNQPFPGKRGSGQRWDACVRKLHSARLCGAIKRAKYG